MHPRYVVSAGPVGWKVYDTLIQLCVATSSTVPLDWRDYVLPTRRAAQKLADQLNENIR